MEQMMELRRQLGDIQESLEELHTTPNKTALGMYKIISKRLL